MSYDEHEVLYITSSGRRTAKPHTIEIWFCERGSSLYILMGGGESADTVRNVRADPNVVVKVGDRAMRATARVVTDEEEASFVRDRIPAKYAHAEEGLVQWARSALPVAIDLPN
jgi:deazaflavin-dependent oxidoreductase (nitroreductase family)